MRDACLLILVASTVCCTTHPAPELVSGNQPSAVATTAAPTPTKASANGTGRDADKNTPSEFGDIDFKNLSYPIAHNPAYTGEANRRSVQLGDGTREYAFKHGGGATYELDDVDYVDINGDRKKEAIVWVSQVVCGGSCDGGAEFVYFYSARKAKPRLLSHLELGSLAYDCGLKSFELNGGSLSVETFRTCRFNGVQFSPIDGSEENGGKFSSNRSTKFWLRFDGTRFVQQRREVVKSAENQNYMNYKPNIEVK